MIKYLKTAILESYLCLTIPISVGITILLSTLGVDAVVNDLARMQNSTFSLVWSAPPLLIGMIAPILFPVLMLRANKKIAILTLKAVIFTVLVVSILKGLTSRIHPEDFSIEDTFIRSLSFQFGLLNNGIASIVEGWPSGHCSSNLVMALTASINGTKLSKILAYFWIVWIFLATVLGISGDVHWLSDSISGVLIGFGVFCWAHSKYLKEKLIA